MYQKRLIHSKSYTDKGVLLTLWIFLIFLFIIGWLNETRVVNSYRSLSLLRDNVIPVSCEANKEYDGHIIHIDCPLQKLYTFYPPSEFSSNVDPFKGVFYETKVEMYQWDFLPILGIFFKLEKQWLTHHVNDSAFPFVFRHLNNNPSFIPVINGAGRRFAPYFYSGSYRLTKKFLTSFQLKQQLRLNDDGYYIPSPERPPTVIDSRTTQPFEDYLYTGDPKNPVIGDLRISFWGSSAIHVSAIGQQKRNPFLTQLVEFSTDNIYANTQKLNHFVFMSSFKTPNIKHVNSTAPFIKQLVFEGDLLPRDMFKRYMNMTQGSKCILWTFRVLACLTLFIILLKTGFQDISKAFFFSFSVIFTSIALLWITSSWMYTLEYVFLSILGLTYNIFGTKLYNVFTSKFASYRVDNSDYRALGTAGVTDYTELPLPDSTAKNSSTITHFYQPV